MEIKNLGGLFNSRKKHVRGFSRKGKTPQQVELQTKEALVALAGLTFLSENDSRQYARNPQSLIGYYAVMGPDKKLRLIGGTRKAVKQEFNLKNDILFHAVVDKGFDAGIGIPILSVNLKGQEVAEVTVQDVVAVTSEFSVDEIACNFPYSLRPSYEPQGPDRYFYIPNAIVSTMRTRRFSSTNDELSGVFSVLSIGGKRHYSNEEVSVRYLVTVTLIPTGPLDGEVCNQFRTPNLGGIASAFPEMRLENFTMSSLDQFAYAEPDVAEAEISKELISRTNGKDLQGVTLDVVETPISAVTL